MSRAMHSVAKVSRFDKGIIAKAFDVNTIGALTSARYVMYPMGTNTKNRLLHE